MYVSFKTQLQKIKASSPKCITHYTSAFNEQDVSEVTRPYKKLVNFLVSNFSTFSDTCKCYTKFYQAAIVWFLCIVIKHLQLKYVVIL